MNAIIEPIMPSITKAEGFIISFNNTHQMIQISRLELQLQYRYEKAIELLKTQEQENLQSIQQLAQLETYQQIENYTYQQLAFFNIQNTDNVNQQEEPNKCPTPKFEDITPIIREPFSEKINISTSIKKKKTNTKLFSFQKDDQYKDKIKRLSYEKPQQQFIVTLPKSGQSFQTSFESLGLKQKQTVADFLQKILNYQSKSIKVYQCNSTMGINIGLENKQPLSELIILPNTEFKIIDIASDIIQGIQIIEFEYGNIEFQAQKDMEYKQKCKFTQDCVEIEERIIKFVNRITFYNFGASSKSALNMKKLNNEEFVKFVKCWCLKNNFDILHIGTHLTVRLL